MFGFNKKRHRSNIRVRKTDDDETENKTESKTSPAPVVPAVKSKKPKNTFKPSKEDKPKMSMLSFDDEINSSEVDFKVKKSSISRKLAREREREKSKKIKCDQETERDLERFQIIDEDLDGVEVEDDDEGDGFLPQPTSPPSPPQSSSVPPTAIPDAYAIHKARKKREEARSKQQDYIPVNRDIVYKKTTSRLVREDDDSDEERIEMKINTEEDDFDEIHLDEGQQDEALARWEEEQIKKGSSFKTGIDVSVGGTRDDTVVEMVTSVLPNGPDSKDYIPSEIVPVVPLDLIYREIESEVASLEELVRSNEQDLESTLNAMELCDSNIIKYEEKSKELSLSFKFYQETKCFINDYSKLMALKMELISELENDIYKLFEGKITKVTSKRRGLQGKLASQLGITSNEQKSVTVDIPSKLPESDDEVDEGFVSDYNTIVDKSEAVMNDVRQEYSELSHVKKIFEKWKDMEGESYRNAFIFECLPRVFEPIIRLEMVGWNPLQSKCPSFEDYGWLSTLMAYGMASDEDSPDLTLIPMVVNKVVIPKIARIVRTCWDPLSVRQTRRLVRVVSLIKSDYPIPSPSTKEKQTKEIDMLVGEIQHQIQQVIIHEAFLPLTADRSHNPDNKTERFLSLQYLKCIKILQNILLWDRVLEDELVFKLAIDSLLNRHLISHLQTSTHHLEAMDKVDMIIKVLPSFWFEESNSLLPQLLPFANYLASLSSNINRKLVQCTTDSDKKSHKLALQKVKSMLLRINARTILTNLTKNNT